MSRPDSHAKLRVVFYCNQLGIGGTEKSIEIFCKNLNREKFEVFVVTQFFRPALLEEIRVSVRALLGSTTARGKKKMWELMNARIPLFQNILGHSHVLLADGTPEDLRKKILDLDPDILHVFYAGRAEPPTSDEFIMRSIPVTLTMNAFELENTAPAAKLIKKYFLPTQWILENACPWAKGDPRAGVFPFAIEKPASSENLRAKLGIPKDAFVLGRVGRPDPGIHDPISLRAYEKIQSENTYFLALSAPENMIAEAAQMGLKNFVPLAPLTSPEDLSKFYNTIDVLAHARRDGETFGCNIAEAMIHGKPVVSHLSNFMEGHIDVLGDTGVMVQKDDFLGYANALKKFRDDPSHRQSEGERCRARVLSLFEAESLTRRLEKIYEQEAQGVLAAISSNPNTSLALS